ncbi:MAG: DUF4384 domain-containing protein [Pseudomonadota bacterium]
MRNKARQGAARKLLNKSTWIGLGLLIMVVGFLIYTRIFLPQTTNPLFNILKEQGYSPNVGFSGAFSPGNLVQIKEPDSNGGERSLKTPIVFLWSSDCFPGINPRVAPFVLPQSRGTSKASLTIGADMLTKLVPSLQIDSNAIVDYTLRIENPRVHTLAKGDLSGRFSEKCVQAYDRQIEAGDKPEWFAVIHDAILAEELVFEIDWRANSSAEARAEATRETTGALNQMLETASPEKQAPAASVDITSEDREHTVIKAGGPVIIGYRTRPLQRQWGEKSDESSSLRDDFYREGGDDASRMIGSLSIMLIESTGTREVRVDHPFRSGDRFRFAVSSNQPGWLYILHRSATGKAQQLWPQQGSQAGLIPHQEIQVGKRYLVPPSPAKFIFDEEVGQEEFIIAIRSQQMAPDLSVIEETIPSEVPDKVESGASPREETTGNIIVVRGDPFTGDTTRGVFFDPGTDDADPRLYFSAAPGDDATKAIVKFKLRHAQ